MFEDSVLMAPHSLPFRSSLFPDLPRQVQTILLTWELIICCSGTLLDISAILLLWCYLFFSLCSEPDFELLGGKRRFYNFRCPQSTCG